MVVLLRPAIRSTAGSQLSPPTLLNISSKADLARPIPSGMITTAMPRLAPINLSSLTPSTVLQIRILEVSSLPTRDAGFGQEPRLGVVVVTLIGGDTIRQEMWSGSAF